MGLFLLWLGTSCWQEQPSKFTVAVTLLLPLFKVLQLQQALRKPSAGPHGRLAAHREENEPCLSWQTLPSRGTFAASAERPVAAALVGRRWFSGQDGLFPPLLPFRKHILLFLPSVFANGGKELRRRDMGQWMTELNCERLSAVYYPEQAISAWVFALVEFHLYMILMTYVWIKKISMCFKTTTVFILPSTLKGFSLQMPVIKKGLI